MSGCCVVHQQVQYTWSKPTSNGKVPTKHLETLSIPIAVLAIDTMGGLPVYVQGKQMGFQSYLFAHIIHVYCSSFT